MTPDTDSLPSEELVHQPAPVEEESGLLDLFIRPGRFFRQRASRMSLGFLLFAAWIAGVLNADEQMEQLYLKKYSLDSHESWASHAVIIAVAGLITGLIIYGILGWWYRVRLFFCGVHGARPRTARAIYLTARLVGSIGAVLLLVWEVATFDAPVEAWTASSSGFLVFAAVMMLFLFWSSVISWRGVLAVFPCAGRIRAAIFFLVLPLGVQCLAFVGGLLLGLSGAMPDRPILTNPARFESCGFGFEYPRNWTINTRNEDYDRNFFLQFDEPNGGTITLEMLELSTPLTHAAEAHWSEFDFPESKSAIRSLGGFAGAGFVGDEDELRYSLFASSLGDDWILEVKACTSVQAWEAVSSGVYLIMNSLRARPAPRQPPDIEHPSVVAFGPALIRVPGNWDHSVEDGSLEIWGPDVNVWFYYYPAEGTVEEEVVLTATNVLDSRAFELEFEQLNRWGPIEGYGRLYQAGEGVGAYRYLFLAGEHGGDSVIEVGVVYSLESQELAKPGLDLIESQMSLDPGDSSASDSP